MKSPPPIPVGFDYAHALLDLRHVMTYEQIAERLGYQSKGSISEIINRKVLPDHPRGEALYALYLERFGRKPPMSQDQAVGKFVQKSAPLPVP